MSTGLSLANLAEERLGGYSFLGGLGTIDRDEQFKEELEKRVRKHSYAPAPFGLSQSVPCFDAGYFNTRQVW